MNHRVDVESLLKTLNRYVPVRHRVLLTRRNTIRMRFIALPGIGCSVLALLATAVLSPVLSQASLPGAEQIASNRPVILGAANADSAEPEQTLLQHFKLSQQRLKRSMEEAIGAKEDSSQAERLASIEPAAGENAPLADVDLAANDPSKPITPQEKTVKIGSGDTLTGVLNRAGLSNDEAYQVVEAVRKHVDPRALKPGQTLNIKFDPSRNDAHNPAFQFASLNMAVDPLRTVSVARSQAEDGYRVDMHEKAMQKHLYAAEATVENSLFGSAAKAGIPVAVISEAIRVYSWNVDFQRDIREGDKIQVMYEQYETPDGVKIKTGNLVYAKLTMGDEEVPIYRYDMKDGGVDYFQPNGRSIRKTLMKTPIDGARVSSGFGLRLHPILGYTKMHKGIDFAAATGTPIYAAGDGTVQKAGRANGYGNYVRLRHNSQLSTAYGHMSRIAVLPGAHVHQGQVIGYVGMTGSATGPHLHYEVLVNDVQVNPRGVNLPTGQILEGNQLKLFQAYARGIDRDRTAGHGARVAQNKPDDQVAAIR